MSAFTEIFGGINILPSQVSYRAVALSVNVTLAWPVETATDTDVVAVIMDVTPSAGSLAIAMPPADETSPGNGALIVNRGAYAFTVTDNLGNSIVSIDPGIGWQIWITDNTTAYGAWASVQYGAGSSSVNAGALAGYGIKAISSTLNQSIAVSELNSNYTVGLPDRAALLNWTGGAGVITLPSAGSAGNDWYFQIRNSGTGAIVITPVGANTIDDAATLTLNPGDSTFVVADGTDFFTLGLGQAPEFTFDYLSIDLTAETSPYILAGAELNRIAYRFAGALTANMIVEVPATVQQYWVTNATTGAFTLTVKVTGGAGVAVAQGAAAILYSNGVDMKAADTGGISTPISIADGGTGATTAAGAVTNLGGTATGAAVFTAASALAGRTALMAAGSGANTDITSLGPLTGIIETVTISATAATGTINYDALTQSVLNYTTNSSANWTMNLRGSGAQTMNATLAIGQALSVVFISKQGATGYYNNVVQVDGTAVGVTTAWQTATPSVGGTSSRDVYTYTIIKTAAATFTVLASLTSFV